MFNLFLSLIITFAATFASGTFSSDNLREFDYQAFSQLPILADGRIKPLDSFARGHLLLFYEKSSLKELSAIQWLAEALFDPYTSYKRQIFRIRNQDVLKALKLNREKGSKDHAYNFIDVSTALQLEMKLVQEIGKLEEKSRSPSQQQILNLYFKMTQFYEISRSLSLLTPQFTMPSPEIALKLDLPFGQRLTYLEVLKRKAVYQDLVEKIYQERKENLSPTEMALFDMGKELETISLDGNMVNFRITPPQLDHSKDSPWHSPWETLIGGHGNPMTAEYFSLWSQMSQHFQDKKIEAFNDTAQKALAFSQKMNHDLYSQNKIKFETKYSQWDLFTKALALYILGLLLILASNLTAKKKLTTSALVIMIVGGILHGIGLALRCYIMGRPPVSTLYESIIFVAFVGVFFATLLEIRQRNALGTFIGTALGSVLIFVSFGYEKDGDTMGMLVAVLDTNFWLATHVVTITIGYGCCFVASLLGHIYLVQRLLNRPKKELTQAINNLLGVTLVSLFFTVLGTILGGIWADQSWGRFWGWDPKENGAMLICMWLLWAIHGRLAGYLAPLRFAFIMSLTSIIVVLAWFGVNLLNVGLHSYGFTDSIAQNLATFSITELLLCGILFTLIKRREAKLIA